MNVQIQMPEGACISFESLRVPGKGDAAEEL